MADTFRLDFVGTKAGIKGASVVMGYLETGMRVLDAASMLLSRLQELAILGANDSNTTADMEAINLEAEAIGDEFNRLMTTSTYKGKDVFVTTAGSEYVSLGGRDAEMTFGIADITYTELYGSARTISGGPNDAGTFNLAHLPSDPVASKDFGTATDGFVRGVKYEVVDITGATMDASETTQADATGDADVVKIIAASDHTGNLGVGEQFTVTSTLTDAQLTTLNTLANGFTFKIVSQTDLLTQDIEAVQAKVNTARVQAGSQYAALESAVSFTTDLTAQYELGFNTVNDVNFSMETAHLAKNQILQQAATAMLAQANQGQQGLLQLIQS
jgi:flagellin